jgi:L-alanine-DL-glutamate epimerase-like enolase superfamily enzyme
MGEGAAQAVRSVKLKSWRFELELTHRWAISSALGPGGSGGTLTYPVVFVELTDGDGVTGIGEAAPSSRYQENPDSTLAFLKQVLPERLSFGDVAGSMTCLDAIAPGHYAPKGAINIALLDGAARRAGQAVCDYLGLGFMEHKHVTSFSIGLDRPEVIRRKVREAAGYPVLKLKVGGPDDRRNLAALREEAPTKPVRVDANEAWKTKEEALRNLEWLAQDRHIQFVEQPMPASTKLEDLAWLKARTPLPIMADESYLSAHDAERCAESFHSVNVKLVKTGGISAGYAALQAARKAGLKTMLGCMIESSVLISAAAHLAELTDYLDIDGNLLITNDPYEGASAEQGVISFARAPGRFGLRVAPRSRTK